MIKQFIVAIFLLLASNTLLAAVGGRTIGGCIYSGNGSVSYVPGAEGEPIATYATDYAPSIDTPAIINAQVLVQDQDSGDLVVYGTMGLDASGSPDLNGNCWEATIPDTVISGIPDATDLIVMFSAPGHDLTSREFTYDEDGRFGHLGDFVHPTGPNVAAGALVEGQSRYVNGLQDAYLPAVADLQTANLLHYVFYDHFTNGADDGLDLDPPLNGVTVRVIDKDGVVVATQETGYLASLGGFTTADGVPYLGAMAYGYVYFEGLAAGDYTVLSDPTTVTQVDNPHMQLSIDHTGDICDTALYGYGNMDCNWYQVYTEEGGHAWEVSLISGSPGTEAGGYMIWHGFIEKIGQVGALTNPFNPMPVDLATAGSIRGHLVDADGNDPEEPFAQILSGRVPPTGATYEDGTLWNSNSNPDLGIINEVPVILPSDFLNYDILPNARIPNGIVAIYLMDGDNRKLVATTESLPIIYYNVPDPDSSGEFTFLNLPAGQYEMYTFDRDLVNVPIIGTGVDVIGDPDPTPVDIPHVLMPRFKARAMGFVKNDIEVVSGATVKVSFSEGSTEYGVQTNSNGWFLHDGLPETGVPGQVYVDIPDGATYRGKIITEEFQRIDPTDPGADADGLVFEFATHNSMSRLVQWWTLNYFVDIQVEDIPAGVGNVMGAVFNDNLAMGSWTGNGLWDDEEEALLSGQTVELLSWTGAVCVPTVVAVAESGVLNQSDVERIGLPPFWPYNETGGVFATPVTFDGSAPAAPAVGFYEFRDVVPGDYCVRVVPTAGFQATAAAPTVITVAGGQNNRVDLGAMASVPLSGVLEGGVFSGLGNLDPNPTSLLFEEAAAIINAPVGVYDHNGYLLGVAFQPDPNCHPYNTSTIYLCSSTVETFQSAEFGRRFAPGAHRYLGNDPAFPDSNIPTGLGGFVQGYDPSFDVMELVFSFNQAGVKSEAAWTPIAPAADSDGDGVDDSEDNCILEPNPEQYDSNEDGYGNICDADLNQDFIVNLSDFSLFRAAFGTTGPGLDADFNGDELVNLSDFSLFRSMFGSAPGPSGVAP